MTLTKSDSTLQTAGSTSETVHKTILAPVDLSGEPGPALDFAVKLARAWQAELYVLHVYSAPASAGRPQAIYAVQGIDWCRRQAQSKLLDWVERLRPRHLRTFPLFEDGECPAQTIQEMAGALKADMIVISTHDRAWLSEWVVYSDADELTRNAATPVLVFRPKRESPQSLTSREQPAELVQDGYDLID